MSTSVHYFKNPALITSAPTLQYYPMPPSYFGDVNFICLISSSDISPPVENVGASHIELLHYRVPVCEAVTNQSSKHNLLSFGKHKDCINARRAAILHNFLFHLWEDCHYLNLLCRESIGATWSISLTQESGDVCFLKTWHLTHLTDLTLSLPEVPSRTDKSEASRVNHSYKLCFIRFSYYCWLWLITAIRDCGETCLLLLILSAVSEVHKANKSLVGSQPYYAPHCYSAIQCNVERLRQDFLLFDFNYYQS